MLCRVLDLLDRRSTRSNLKKLELYFRAEVLEKNANFYGHLSLRFHPGCEFFQVTPTLLDKDFRIISGIISTLFKPLLFGCTNLNELHGIGLFWTTAQ